MRLHIPFALLLAAWLLAACVVVPAPTPTPPPTDTPTSLSPTPTEPPPTATAMPQPTPTPTVAVTTAWQELWRRSFKMVGAAASDFLPGLATWHDTIFIASSQGVLYQIYIPTGDILWQFPLWPEGARGGAGARIAVVGDKALIAASDLYMEGPSSRFASFRSRFVWLDIPTRQMVRDFGVVRNGGFDWLMSGSRMLLRATPAGGLAALDVQSGRVLWQAEDALPLAADEGAFYVSRAPTTFVPYNDPNYLTRQTVLALDAQTGAVRWQVKPPLPDYLRLGLVGGGQLILLGDLRTMVALSLDDSSERWRRDDVSLWPYYYGVATDDQRLYGTLMATDELAAFHLSDGATAWRVAMAGSARFNIAVRAGRLYQVFYTYTAADAISLHLRVLDAATGETVETVALGESGVSYANLVLADKWLLLIGQEVMAFGAGQPVGTLEPVQPVDWPKHPLPPLPLYFESARSGVGNIWRVLSDKTGFVNVSNSGDPNWDPAPSPDGQWIAFESYRTGKSEIWRMRSDGADPRQLTSTDAPDIYNAHPTWSPDGEDIAFASNRSGEHQIWVMNRDGGELRMLTDTGRNVDPAWSPDGRTIAFISNRLGRNDLWLMDADGGNQRPLIANDRHKSLPAWSPDGTRLAYVRHALETGDEWGEVYIVDVATGLQWPAPYTAWGQDRNPAFSPDGTRLAWARKTDDPGKPQVWIVRLDAQEPLTIIEDAKDPAWGRW